MTDFTRDCLRFCVRVGTDRPETFNIASRDNPDANIASLAAFAIALLDRAEKAEAERDRLREELREATVLLSDTVTEMEASGGWDGDENLFNRIMTHIRARERAGRG